LPSDVNKSFYLFPTGWERDFKYTKKNYYSVIKRGEMMKLIKTELTTTGREPASIKELDLARKVLDELPLTVESEWGQSQLELQIEKTESNDRTKITLRSEPGKSLIYSGLNAIPNSYEVTMRVHRSEYISQGPYIHLTIAPKDKTKPYVEIG
jgi:hypothetical protein